jgi:hypothetical protein
LDLPSSNEIDTMSDEELRKIVDRFEFE